MNGSSNHETVLSSDKRPTSTSLGKNKTESYENLLINKYLDDIATTE